MSAYFQPDERGLVPAPEARSPWAADMLHGRLLSGLAARAVEHEVPDPSYRLTRLTVDMFKSPPMEPIQVTSAIVRDGRRVKAVDVSMASAGAVVGRASAILLRVGPQPQSTPWSAAPWSVALPDELGDPTAIAPGGGWDIRMLSEGGFATADRKRVWARDTWPLVAGEPLSPGVRAALAADLPNPLANSGADGLLFINADLTMSLYRPPASDWIGLETSAHLSADGVAIGSCTMYDLDGPIGWSTVCAVSNLQGLAT